MAEGFKEFMSNVLATQTAFGSLQFIVASGFWIAILTKMDNIYIYEEDGFKCNMDRGIHQYVNRICHSDYAKIYNKPLALNDLAWVNGLLLLSLWVLYSFFAAKRLLNQSTNREALKALHPRIFRWYIGQMLCRVLLCGAAFILMLTIVPINFPVTFHCERFNVTTGGGTEPLHCTTYHNLIKTKLAFSMLVFDIVFVGFAFIEIFYVLVSLQRKTQTDYEMIALLTRLPVRLKEEIKNQSRYFRMFGPEQLKLTLEDVYVEPNIYFKTADKSRGRTATPVTKLLCPPSDDFLQLLHKGEKRSRNILAVGSAAIGKSTLCQKLLLEWSAEKTNSNTFNYVFLFNFRQLNQIDENLTLLELLCAGQFSCGDLVKPREDELNDIKSCSERVLLIFDGLNEFRDARKVIDLIRNGSRFREEYSKPMPLAELYYQIFKGKILKGCTTITMTRDIEGLTEMENQCDSTIEILGFDKEKVEAYVKKSSFILGSEAKRSVKEQIFGRPNLLNLCFVPFNCFLISYYLSTEDQTQLPSTLTRLYEGVLRMFLNKFHPKSTGLVNENAQGAFTDTQVEEIVDRLSSVALSGIKEHKIIFEDTDFKKSEQEAEDWTKCGVLLPMPGSNSKTYKVESQYIFLHYTFQEFLAARQIGKYYSQKSLQDITESMLRDATESTMILQFLAGILSVPLYRLEEGGNDDLLDTLLEKLSTIPRNKQLLAMKCLFEYGKAHLKTTNSDKNRLSRVIKQDLAPKIDLRGQGITDTDCAALAFVLCGDSSGLVTEVDVSGNFVGDTGCGNLAQVVQAEYCQVSALNLKRNEVSDDGIKYLAEALQSSGNKLVYLNLESNRFSSKGADYLKRALQSEHCKIRELFVSDNDISREDRNHLERFAAETPQ